MTAAAATAFTLNDGHYTAWKGQTGNEFAAAVENEVKQWLTASAIALIARRQVNNAIIADMRASLAAGNNADAEARARALVARGEECLQAAQAERHHAQQEFDRIFTPTQKVRIIVHAVEAVNDPMKAADVLAAILHDACRI